MTTELTRLPSPAESAANPFSKIIELSRKEPSTSDHETAVTIPVSHFAIPHMGSILKEVIIGTSSLYQHARYFGEYVYAEWYRLKLVMEDGTIVNFGELPHTDVLSFDYNTDSSHLCAIIAICSMRANIIRQNTEAAIEFFSSTPIIDIESFASWLSTDTGITFTSVKSLRDVYDYSKFYTRASLHTRTYIHISNNDILEDANIKSLYVTSNSGINSYSNGSVINVAAVIDKEDRLFYSPNIASSYFGVMPGSKLVSILAVASSCSSKVLSMLNTRHDSTDTLRELYQFSMDDLEEIKAFLVSNTITSLEVFDSLIRNFTSIDDTVVINSFECSRYQYEWMYDLIRNPNVLSTAEAHRMARRLLEHGSTVQITAVDISEFARTEIPNNPLVESVTPLEDNRVRVVLRELVYPTVVLRRGVMYIEDDPGTVLSDMGIYAFDLEFRGSFNSFPNAVAYADQECTQKARHTNISAGGLVCLGDINNYMSTEEIKLRGNAMPCIGDFIQMLRQCNLDSAYRRAKEFVLADPDMVSESQWNAATWNIPGLRRIENAFSFNND